MPWSFKGQSFALSADSSIFDEWFADKTLHTVDPLLGSSGGRYVDIGGTDIQPFSGIAQWSGGSAATARATLRSYRGAVGTLTDDDGRSCQALLSDTIEIRVKATNSGYTRLGVTFVYVSA